VHRAVFASRVQRCAFAVPAREIGAEPGAAIRSSLPPSAALSSSVRLCAAGDRGGNDGHELLSMNLESSSHVYQLRLEPRTRVGLRKREAIF